MICFYFRNFWAKEGETFIFLPEVVYSNFVALPFTWSALFCCKFRYPFPSQKNFLYARIILADFFGANFFKEIAKSFSRSARTSANNSSLFLSSSMVVCSFTFFVCHNDFLKFVESLFVIIRIDFITLQWCHNIRFYYFFYF